MISMWRSNTATTLIKLRGLLKLSKNSPQPVAPHQRRRRSLPRKWPRPRGLRAPGPHGVARAAPTEDVEPGSEPEFGSQVTLLTSQQQTRNKVYSLFFELNSRSEVYNLYLSCTQLCVHVHCSESIELL